MFKLFVDDLPTELAEKVIEISGRNPGAIKVLAEIAKSDGMKGVLKCDGLHPSEIWDRRKELGVHNVF